MKAGRRCEGLLGLLSTTAVDGRPWIGLLVSLSVTLSISLSVSLLVTLSISLSVSLSVTLSVSLFNFPFGSTFLPGLKETQAMADRRVFTLSQVAQHKSKKDCWFVINGRVLDVTKFLEEHSEGEEVLIEAAGKDATKEFEEVGHSKAAQNMLVKYQVDILQGFKVQEGDAGAAASYKETKGQEMSAFVIKEDGLSNFKSFTEFFVPLLVAGFFFGYRSLTTVA